jgi:hypothetical protein
VSFVEDLTALQAEARRNGEERAAELCDRALSGDRASWELLRSVVCEAQIIAAEAEPACDECGMQLARFAGPGDERGFTCVRCDEVQP